MSRYEHATTKLVVGENFELSENQCTGVNNLQYALQQLDAVQQRLSVLDPQHQHAEQFKSKEVDFEHSPTTLLVQDAKVYVQMCHNRLLEQMTKQVGVSLAMAIREGVLRVKATITNDLEAVDDIVEPILDSLDQTFQCANDYLFTEVGGVVGQVFLGKEQRRDVARHCTLQGATGRARATASPARAPLFFWSAGVCCLPVRELTRRRGVLRAHAARAPRHLGHTTRVPAAVR